MPTYEIVETVDGDYMILVNGFQWGDDLDKSGAGNVVFKSWAWAALKVQKLMDE